jgi:hypothetical protein
MANERDDFDETMREITAHRDELIERNRAISAERLQRLQRTLSSELPLESAFSDAARLRDEMLSERIVMIPTSVEGALTDRLLARVQSSPRGGWLLAMYRGIVRSWRFAHAAAAVGLATAVAVVGAGVVLTLQSFSKTKPVEVAGDPQVVALQEPLAAEDAARESRAARGGDNFLRPSANQLTLRISTTELALLQASLLTARYVPDERDAGLPLDLPIRQSLMDAEPARMP